MGNKIDVPGILILYNFSPFGDANTIIEHINSFQKYSKYQVLSLNTEYGFPVYLSDFSFSVIILHYSLFGTYPYKLSMEFLNYIEENSFKFIIGFFQDEYQYCNQRYKFINDYNIQCIYSLISQEFFQKTYYANTTVKTIITTLPGYVSDNLICASKLCLNNESKKKIDVGYRGRELPVYMGRGAYEKREICENFLHYASDSSLIIDIETKENKRKYGKKWDQFLSNCKGVLGVEAGVSIFDYDGKVYDTYLGLQKSDWFTMYHEMQKKIDIERYENNIFYRMISPRHFEAAAFRACQILFEGYYSGILKPNIHYIPLKKDFSNIDWVINRFLNKKVREKIVENAYNDLILSGAYSYKTFISTFDEYIMKNELCLTNNVSVISYVNECIKKDLHKRLLFYLLKLGKKYIPSI